ncbi:DUF6503 family protein [Winogradskyella sp. 3972H.M.0a.05]|uniref:DUF6503 family protein n=1 Tax=Winogradskyella sp. 3972H.M.0a.05 TaxID=2950277 RepID=UPI003399A4EE
MKTNTIFICLLLLVMSCKDNKTVESPVNYEEEQLDVTTSVYPENITKVFEAHGGLDAWKKSNTLVFAMENPEGVETTTTDLKNRRSLIETEKFKIGFDGNEVWMVDEEKAYKGNPKFYYNLMFYFYAMPYVLADDGIVYEDVEPLEFEGKSYPGIKIGYEAGVGESPEDEYILYYNPETYQMEWLGYTVTFFSKEKDTNFRFIKYDQWEDLAGMKLPKAIQWYNYEGSTVKDMRNELKFTGTSASAESMADSFYAKPEGATVIE